VLHGGSVKVLDVAELVAEQM